MGTSNAAILDARMVPGSAPVYAYRFDWQTPIMGGKLYSPHTIEIPYVFDNTSTTAGTVMTGGGAKAAALAEIVSSAWAEFARTGKPAARGLPEWPEYSIQRHESMHIDTTSRVAQYIDAALVVLYHDKLWKAAGLS